MDVIKGLKFTNNDLQRNLSRISSEIQAPGVHLCSGNTPLYLYTTKTIRYSTSQAGAEPSVYEPASKNIRFTGLCRQPASTLTKYYRNNVQHHVLCCSKCPVLNPPFLQDKTVGNIEWLKMSATHLMYDCRQTRTN